MALKTPPQGAGKQWPTLVPLGHLQGKPAIPLRRPVTVLGARQNAHIHLISRKVSQTHAIIVSSGSHVYIRDLESRTHVYVNGKQEREAQLHEDDLVQIGD